MTRRKTIKVEEMKARANHFLLHSDDDAKRERLTWIVIIESILMDTENYKGFMYLNAERMFHSESGISVGINDVRLPIEERFRDTDHSRVAYY